MAVRLPGGRLDQVARRAFVQQCQEQHIAPEMVLNILGYLRREPGRRFMPLAADVRRIAEGNKSIPHRASELAGKIAGTIGRIGYNDSKGARAYLGEDAWRCVSNMYNGWPALASQWPDDLSKQGILRAQMRNWIEQDLQAQEEQAARDGQFPPLIELQPPPTNQTLGPGAKGYDAIRQNIDRIGSFDGDRDASTTVRHQGDESRRVPGSARGQQLDD